MTRLIDVSAIRSTFSVHISNQIHVHGQSLQRLDCYCDIQIRFNLCKKYSLSACLGDIKLIGQPYILFCFMIVCNINNFPLWFQCLVSSVPGLTFYFLVKAKP